MEELLADGSQSNTAVEESPLLVTVSTESILRTHSRGNNVKVWEEMSKCPMIVIFHQFILFSPPKEGERQKTCMFYFTYLGWTGRKARGHITICNVKFSHIIYLPCFVKCAGFAVLQSVTVGKVMYDIPVKTLGLRGAQNLTVHLQWRGPPDASSIRLPGTSVSTVVRRKLKFLWLK